MSLIASRIARREAQKLLNQHPRKTGTEVDVKDIALKLEIDIISGEFKDQHHRNISGLLKFSGKNGRPVIAIKASESPQRQRFTIAHEIGHYILHKSELVHVDPNRNLEPLAFRDASSSTATSIKEIQANQFAAELLMPTIEVCELLIEDHGKDVEITKTIEKIAQTYNVSPMAATIKVSSLIGLPF